MTLFLFDHCPFCIKAQMVAGFKQLPIKLVYLQNHDVNARIEKVGANLVPIIEKKDGSFMAESLDIASYLDQVDNNPVIEKATYAEEIETWLLSIRPYSGILTFPRITQINLPEFQHPDAITYFTNNKSKMLNMSFDIALTKTEESIKKLKPLLDDVNFITLPSEKGHKITWDDINFFPFLRSLTIIKGLNFPQHLINYLNEVSELTDIDLYFDVAI